MVALVSASVLTPVRAQEFTTAVTDRVEPEVESVPTLSGSGLRRGGLELGVVVAVAYDDNIFLSKKDPESDTIIRLGPAIAYTQGDIEEGEGGFVRFAYRPTAVSYVKNSTENRIDHEAAISAGWRGKASKITYTGAVRKLGDATADTGRPTDRLESENEIRAGWITREKVTLEVAAGNNQSQYNDPTFFDSNDSYAEVAVRYAYSPKTEVALAYQAGRYKVDGAGNQTTRQITAGLDWQPSEKIRVNVAAGAERRQTDAGTEVNPVFEGRLEWVPREGSALFITGYQKEEASAYFAGQNYNVKGATAGISQRLGEKWTARLEGGFEKATYSRVAGTGGSGRKDKIWFVRPAFVYQITDEFDVSLFYRVSDNSSTSADFGYDQQMAGVEMNFQF